MHLRNLLKRWSRDPLVRRKAWNKYFERRLHRHGLHIYKGHLDWALDPELAALHAEWGKVPGNPADRVYFVWELGRMIRERGIEGATAECGSRFGKSTFFLLSGLADPQRAHHIFDSFAGLSESTAEDRARAGIRTWQAGEMSVDEQTARAQLAAWPQCVFHKGWIPDRFDDVADETFACVHIDVDLYEPTRATLEFFWPRLAAGGVIVSDDYGLATCPGVKRAFEEFFADRPEHPLPLPSGQVLVWKDRMAA
ncbi:MAG TPA: TylF/MycF/NovP-related O-methyltransferase [Pseudomonadales bacterium]|nr:TylF/MycF/NovP-related O-methyltransferase [Pseudomonadales bacterium]